MEYSMELDDSRFATWKQRVDQHVQALCGLTCDDLPDVCYRDWFDEGLHYIQAAKRTVRSANGQYSD